LPCECGCGQSVRGRFRKGHWARTPDGRAAQRASAARRRGVPLSEKHRLAIGKALVGLSHTPETRRKLSEIAKQQGRRPSAEAVARSNANRGKGAANPSWKGGRINSNGYRMVYAPEHPRATGPSRNYVYEHVLVAEEQIGRLLVAGEVVHHIDGDKLNNASENLLVCANQAEHMRIHRDELIEAAYRAGFEAGAKSREAVAV
jgi:hypothetical protein